MTNAVLFCLLLASITWGEGTPKPRCIEPDPTAGMSAAVVVEDVPLLHTTQVFAATNSEPAIAPQVESALSKLDELLAASNSGLDHCVKLNFYLTSSDLKSAVHSALAQRFAGGYQPAVSFVVTALPHPTARLSVDAVATTRTLPAARPRQQPAMLSPAPDDQQTARLSLAPRGSRIYISGQAARAPSLREATAATLEGLTKTLASLRRKREDVLQIKCFLQPMQEVSVVREEIHKLFGKHTVPPLVLVEWTSTVPIEIEWIVYGGANRTGEMVEYLTPPGMKPSPVFSRVARVNHSSTIYVSGLYASKATAAGDAEVKEIFTNLQRILKKSGSDLRHLAKATYYVAGDDSSRSLNALRPDYYDPNRPPAASKAAVAGTGAGGQLTMDLIATPSVELGEEYGPEQYGHGLSRAMAEEGWLALYDGMSTTGWRNAEQADGQLRAGTSNTAFSSFELRVEASRPSTIRWGDRKVLLQKGEFETTLQGKPAFIEVLDGALRTCIVKPLRLTPMFGSGGLAGWKPIHRNSKPTWTRKSGVLRVEGGPGCLQYERVKFGNFVLQMEVRTLARHANGGLFFRAIEDDFMNGYEAQIFNRAERSNPTRPAYWSTGAIDDRVNARRLVSRDGRFFRLTVIAQGPRIATWVNGFQQVDWVDTRPEHKNARQGRRTKPGVIQIQAHDAATKFEIRRMEVRRLP